MRLRKVSPQGVFEENLVEAIHKEDWLGYSSSGQRVQMRQATFVQWNEEKQKFDSEFIYFDSDEPFLQQRKEDYEKKMMKRMMGGEDLK